MTIKTKTQSKKPAAKASARKGPRPRVGEWLPLAAGFLVIVGIAVGIWWGIKQQYPEDHTTCDPVLATVGKAEAPVTLDLYEDFLCPACAQFEAAYGEELGKTVGEGKVRLRFHMLNFLNRGSASGDYSSRASGAALSVFRKAPEKFLAFHSKLFAKDVQPQEGGDSDLSNDQLAKIAEEVGAGAAAADIRSGANVKEAAGSATASIRLLKSLSTTGGTPSILKDDKVIETWRSDPQWLQKLVDEAAGPAPAPAPKPAG